MRKIQLLFLALFCFLTCFSQDLLSDFADFSTSNCNAFGTGTSVPSTLGGVSSNITYYSHYGQPFYTNGTIKLNGMAFWFTLFYMVYS